MPYYLNCFGHEIIQHIFVNGVSNRMMYKNKTGPLAFFMKAEVLLEFDEFRIEKARMCLGYG
jgi:hypothetical protein